MHTSIKDGCASVLEGTDFKTATRTANMCPKENTFYANRTYSTNRLKLGKICVGKACVCENNSSVCELDS